MGLTAGDAGSRFGALNFQRSLIIFEIMEYGLMLSALRLPVNKKAIEVGIGVLRAHPFRKARGKGWGTCSYVGRSIYHIFSLQRGGPSMSRGNPAQAKAWTGHPREQNEPMVWATRPAPLEQQRLSLSGELPDAACISDFYCPTGLFIGTSVDAPHCCVMILLLLLCMTYQVPFDGRHTAKSALRSPS